MNTKKEQEEADIFLDIMKVIVKRGDLLNKEGIAYMLSSKDWGRCTSKYSEEKIKSVFEKLRYLLEAFHDGYNMREDFKERVVEDVLLGVFSKVWLYTLIGLAFLCLLFAMFKY